MDMFSVVPRFSVKDTPLSSERYTQTPQQIRPEEYQRHFVAIVIVVFAVILLSITLGVFLGAPLSAPGVNLGMQVSIAAVVQIFIFYIAFNTHTLDGPLRDIRLNPYMSLVDWLLEGRISAEVFFIEFFAQTLGAVCASALFYALVYNSTFPFLPASGPIGTNVSVGAGFVAEMVSSALMAWVFFSNRAHGNRVRMALSMAYIVGVTAGFVFPFIGLTTHSPFRWLASCVPSQSCGASGFWIFFTAPLAGITIGNLAHRLTSIEKKQK